MLPKPSVRLFTWGLGVCVALLLGYVVAWLVFGFHAYTLWGFAGALLTGLAFAGNLREMRKRERRGDPT